MDEWRAGFTIYLYQFRVGGTRTIIKLFFFFFCDSKTILSGAAARPSIENWEIVLMDYSTYYYCLFLSNSVLVATTRTRRIFHGPQQWMMTSIGIFYEIVFDN